MFIEQAAPAGDFPELREKQHFICSTLFSKHDTSSLHISLFGGFNTLACKTNKLSIDVWFVRIGKYLADITI